MINRTAKAYRKPKLRELGRMSRVTRKSGPGSDGLSQDPKGQP